jgi:hypothetical protein
MFLAFQWALAEPTGGNRLFGFEDIGASDHFVEGAVWGDAPVPPFNLYNRSIE